MTPRSMTGVMRVLGALVFFVLLAVAHTWPLASSRFIVDRDDTINHLWALNTTARQLVRDPLHPLEGNIFYPFPHSLAVVDHVLANALLAVPLHISGMDPVSVYNVVLIATFALSGFFTWLLVVRLTGSGAAGLVAGCAYAFCTFRWNHLSHLHLLSTQWIPLALIALHAFLDRPTRGRLAAFGAAALLVGFSSWQIAVLGALTLGVIALAVVVTDGRPAIRRLAMLVVAATVVGAALVPLAATYRSIARGSGARETTGVHSDLSLRVEGLLAPVPRLRGPHEALLSQFGLGESRAFPGIVVLLLCAAGGSLGGGTSPRARRLSVAIWATLCVAGVLTACAAAGWPVEWLAPMSPVVLLGTLALGLTLIRARLVVREGINASAAAYGALALAGVLLALGPRVRAWGHDLGPGVYASHSLPFLLLLSRAPARFSLLLMLATAVLAGFGFARVRSRLRPRAAVGFAVLVLVVMNAEMRTAPLPLQAAWPRVPVHVWLANLKEPGAIAMFPRTLSTLFESLYHGRSMVNGLGYYFPAAIEALGARNDLSPRQVALLWEVFHPRFIVVRAGAYNESTRTEVLNRIARQQDAFRLRARFGTDLVYELLDRGVGSTLVRRWPREALRDAAAFELTGAVHNVPADRVGVLLAELNGMEVLRVEGWSATMPGHYAIPVKHEALRAGENMLTIQADYIHPPNAPRYAIGSTGVSVPADVRVVSARDGATVQVNGRTLMVEKGYMLIVLEPRTGAIRGWAGFNTSWYEDDAAKLAAFVKRLPAGAPVIVASEFDVSRRLTAGAVAALGELGLAADLRGRFQWGHAAIGVKGATRGSALESANNQTAEIVLGSPAQPEVRLMDLTVLNAVDGRQ